MPGAISVPTAYVPSPSMVVRGPSWSVGSAWATPVVRDIAITTAAVTKAALLNSYCLARRKDTVVPASAVPDGYVVRRVVGAVVGFLGCDTLVVEEDLHMVWPRQPQRVDAVVEHIVRIAPSSCVVH